MPETSFIMLLQVKMSAGFGHVTGFWISNDGPTTMTPHYSIIDDSYAELPLNVTIPRPTATTVANSTGFVVAESFVARYLLPFVVAAGTFGNITSLAVLLRRRMRRTSVYMYLTVLACADLSVLYLSAFKTWIRLVIAFSMFQGTVWLSVKNELLHQSFF